MTRVLILRPRPGADATAARAAALGLDATVAPLFTVAALPWDAPAPGDHDALMLTSANAARLGGAQLAAFHALPVFAVGEATAVAAREAGFDDVRAGDADAVALLDRIAAAGFRHVLHLSGREYRDAGHPALTIDRVAVYAADPMAELPTQAMAALADGAVALLHSPRAAARFAALAGDRAAIRIAAISPVAAAAAGDGWACVAVADRPDDAALLAAAARLCDQAGRMTRTDGMVTEQEAQGYPPPPQRPGGARNALLLGGVAFLAGIAATAYTVHAWRPAAELLTDRTPIIIPPAPVPQQQQPVQAVPSLPPVDPMEEAGIDRRVGEIEARLGRIDARANAAESNADRAEGLLVAFAARRALDRGVQLGYIEGLLRDRFGRTQADAVRTIIAASRDPVTLESLRADLSDIAPGLSSPAQEENWWEGMKRELSGMIVLRKANTPSPAPADRLARARRALEADHVAEALAEVARMPGRDRAGNWIADARRYVAARDALDRIETAALLAPRPKARPEPADDSAAPSAERSGTPEQPAIIPG